MNAKYWSATQRQRHGCDIQLLFFDQTQQEVQRTVEDVERDAAGALVDARAVKMR